MRSVIQQDFDYNFHNFRIIFETTKKTTLDS
jgi:hypothetical protein